MRVVEIMGTNTLANLHWRFREMKKSKVISLVLLLFLICALILAPSVAAQEDDPQDALIRQALVATAEDLGWITESTSDVNQHVGREFNKNTGRYYYYISAGWPYNNGGFLNPFSTAEAADAAWESSNASLLAYYAAECRPSSFHGHPALYQRKEASGGHPGWLRLDCRIDRFTFSFSSPGQPDPREYAELLYANMVKYGLIGGDGVPDVTEPPPPTPGACDWTGTWDTNWGKMELVQTGNQVTGTASLTLPQRTNLTGSYKPDNGKIEGKVSGNTLIGTWSEAPSYSPPNEAGDFEFTISPDCNSFTGKWRYGSTGDWRVGDWTGSRVGPSKPPSKQTVCASAKPRIAGASEFKSAEFTIGGMEPQKVRITQPAENFGIVNVYGGRYGGRVYQRIDGKSWGSLTLEPGTYRLSCGGGGAMDLMSATVCIEYPAAKEVPPKPEEKEKPPMEEVKPSLPLGPIERIIVRPSDNLEASELVMEIGKKKRFMAWGEDAVGHKISVTVKDWEVSDTSIGSIDKDGIFKAGPKEGKVKIRATVKNQEGNDITGAFPITVTEGPPITFKGCVKLFDENDKPLPPSGVKVQFSALFYENYEVYYREGYTSYLAWEELWSSKTDAAGNFKAMSPAVGGFASTHSSTVFAPTPPAGYRWVEKQSHISGGRSDAIEWKGPIKAGSTIHIAPSGFLCLQLWLEKCPTSLQGEVTHKRKPVDSAKVRLLDNNGNSVEETLSGKYNSGEYELYVDNRLKGSYRLTANYKPPKGTIKTVHNRLYIKKDIPVDLPLKTQTKTINIELISWGEKIGYTGP